MLRARLFYLAFSLFGKVSTHRGMADSAPGPLAQGGQLLLRLQRTTAGAADNCNVGIAYYMRRHECHAYSFRNLPELNRAE